MTFDLVYVWAVGPWRSYGSLEKLCVLGEGPQYPQTNGRRSSIPTNQQSIIRAEAWDLQVNILTRTGSFCHGMKDTSMLVSGAYDGSISDHRKFIRTIKHQQ